MWFKATFAIFTKLVVMGALGALCLSMSGCSSSSGAKDDDDGGTGGGAGGAGGTGAGNGGAGGGGGPSCQQFCADFCRVLGTCSGVDTTNCAANCEQGLSDRACRSERPPDQLTCTELKSFYDCTIYCGTFCARAPQCGSFDQTVCVEGCSDLGPLICNAWSVAARTCDQLKPEARDYDDAGRALREGRTPPVIIGRTGASYGLCRSASDCSLPLACQLATNTCGACTVDMDCTRGLSGKYACIAGQCTNVECVKDGDCILEVCDLPRHVCVECLADKDCRSTRPACKVETQTCVECLTDAHCTWSTLRKACKAESCVECTRDEHCVGATLGPKCETSRNGCVECLSAADCKDPTRPYCRAGSNYCSSLP